MPRGPKSKEKIICPRCNRKAQPCRGYCRNCASVLVAKGEIPKVLVDNMPKKLTDEQNQILNGLMLGDGCLYRRKDTHSPYLAVTRSQNDRDYLVENYRTFSVFCKRGVMDGEIFDKRTGNITYYSKFITRRASVFSSHYEKWYPEGVKIIPYDLELTPLIMAIWFADDGCIGRSCSAHRMRLKLSTDGFEKKYVDVLKLKLEEICQERFGITKNKSIISSDAGARAFANVIDNFLPMSMVRKAYWKKEESRFYDDQPKRMNPDIGKHHETKFYRN